MTANQLSYQRNLVAEDEARTRDYQARIEAAKAAEAARHNLEAETLTRREQNIDKALRESVIEQQERENKAKYGEFAYTDYGEELPLIGKIAKMVPDVFSYLLKPISSIFKAFK